MSMLHFFSLFRTLSVLLPKAIQVVQFILDVPQVPKASSSTLKCSQNERESWTTSS
jgi:hypothetical protein